MLSSSQKIWFITGVSSGFGHAFLDQVIASGGYVVGSLRKAEQVEEFKRKYAGKASFIQMDVNYPEQIEAGVKTILHEYGRIDVLVNNAGYGLFGAVEEASSDEIRAQMETNFFGPLALTQAVLPIMRKQKSGHIVQISSIAGFRATPGLGIYNASKFALEGFSEALAQEVGPLGIHVTLVEPGPFRTKWAGGGAQNTARRIDDYAATAHATSQMIHGYDGNQPGDPEKAVALVIKAVSSPNPPLHLPLGKMAIERMRGKMDDLEQEVSAWEKDSLATSFDNAA